MSLLSEKELHEVFEAKMKVSSDENELEVAIWPLVKEQATFRVNERKWNVEQKILANINDGACVAGLAVGAWVRNWLELDHAKCKVQFSSRLDAAKLSFDEVVDISLAFFLYIEDNDKGKNPGEWFTLS